MDRLGEDRIDKDIHPSGVSRFAPPTLDEVKAYCQERGNNVDAQKFIDFYESKGWMIGKNKMKSWQAAVRTWERESTSTPARARQRNTMLNYEEQGVSHSNLNDITFDMDEL